MHMYKCNYHACLNNTIELNTTSQSLKSVEDCNIEIQNKNKESCAL